MTTTWFREESFPFLPQIYVMTRGPTQPGKSGVADVGTGGECLGGEGDCVYSSDFMFRIDLGRKMSEGIQ